MANSFQSVPGFLLRQDLRRHGHGKIQFPVFRRDGGEGDHLQAGIRKIKILCPQFIIGPDLPRCIGSFAQDHTFSADLQGHGPVFVLPVLREGADLPFDFCAGFQSGKRIGAFHSAVRKKLQRTDGFRGVLTVCAAQVDHHFRIRCFQISRFGIDILPVTVDLQRVMRSQL